MNANSDEKICLAEFQENANNNLGLNQTFDKSAILFVVIGMVFGWPYALHHFSALQWINTSMWKRIARMMIGVPITVGVQFFFLWAIKRTNDIPTKFFFGYAVPYFINSFFIFGIFPIVCKYMKLVQGEEHFAVQYPDLASTSFIGGNKASVDHGSIPSVPTNGHGSVGAPYQEQKFG